MGTKQFRGTLLTSHVGPEVIIYDRDLVLMNAINIVFPKATNIFFFCFTSIRMTKQSVKCR